MNSQMAHSEEKLIASARAGSRTALESSSTGTLIASTGCLSRS